MQNVSNDKAKVVAIDMGNGKFLPDTMRTWRMLFEFELAALRRQKQTNDPDDGPVLFQYGTLVDAGSSLSIAEKESILETLAKGWTRVTDSATWQHQWTLTHIALAEQACAGALTLIDAKLLKLDAHVESAGHTEVAKDMRSYIASTLNEMADVIVDKVLPRLREGKSLLLEHNTSKGGA